MSDDGAVHVTVTVEYRGRTLSAVADVLPRPFADHAPRAVEAAAQRAGRECADMLAGVTGRAENPARRRLEQTVARVEAYLDARQMDAGAGVVVHVEQGASLHQQDVVALVQAAKEALA